MTQQTGRSLTIRSHRTIAIILVTVLLGVLYLWQLGDNPIAVFCDEALIGLLAHDPAGSGTEFFGKGLFFDHFDTVAGSLPVWTTMPFVRLFGLSAITLRMGSTIFVLATALVAWLTLRLLRAPSPWFGALVFLGTPLAVHLGHINFGHAPSIFLIMLGWYFMARSRVTDRSPWGLLAGICWGAAAYGYPGFYVYIPMLVAVTLSFQFSPLRLSRRAGLAALHATGVALLAYLPIIYQSTHRPEFFERLRLKEGEGPSGFSFDRIAGMVQNYPKYVTWEYLFVSGETGAPGGTIQRHAVMNSGVLPWVMLPLVLVCLAVLVQRRSRFPYPWAVPAVSMMILAPLPDLLTTQLESAPYSFSMAMSLWTIPFVASAGLGIAQRLWNQFPEPRRSTGQPPLLSGSVRTWLTSVLIIQMLVLALALYPASGLKSGGYWGWQWGIEPLSGWWQQHHAGYTGIVIEPLFNRADTLTLFYLDDDSLASSMTFSRVEPTDIVAPGTVIAISDRGRLPEYIAAGWTLVAECTHPRAGLAWFILSPPAGVPTATPGG